MTELADRLPPVLGKVIRQAARIKLAICAIATLILPITFFFVVVFRYGLERDLFAYEEWLLPIAFWLYFLASAVGSYQDSHIRADILESFFRSPRAFWIRKIILNLIETFLTLVMAYWAWLMIADELAKYPNWQTTIGLGIPFFVPRLGIMVGIVFMALYEFLHLYVMVRYGHESTDEEFEEIHKELGDL